MQTLKMDFQSQSTPPVVPVMQSDSQSRFIGIILYNGGVPYEAPEGASYTVQYRGPGANNMGWYDTIQLSSGTRKAVIVDSASKNVVTLELAEQTLRVNGNVFVNLCVVTNTGYMLKTFPILCRVTGAAFPDAVAVQSFFYVTGITSEQWLAYVTACQDAQKRAEDAAATFETDPTLTLSGKAADAKATGDSFKKCQLVDDNLIIGADQISDFNSVRENSTYVLAILADNPPKNIPTDYPLTGTTAYLETYNVEFPGSFTVQQKITFISKDYYYYRECVGNTTKWTTWEKYYTKDSTSGGQVKIYIGSTRKYKTLRAGLLEAVRHEGCEVYVDAETFDIIKEYGDTFFENFSSPTNEYGLALGNGIKVHFASGSKVVCNYTGSNHAINEEFSVFHVYASSQGFLLDNVTIEASNVRYCVHDEHGIDPTPYKNIYENCSMYIDNAHNPVWGPDTPCIGGGLGKHGEVIVDGCVFEATSSTQRTGVVSYHNSSASGAKSNLIFKNNYFKGANSGLRFGWYGDSDEITNIIITGNSYTLEPYLRAENESATKENMRILKYNNELRT